MIEQCPFFLNIGKKITKKKYSYIPLHGILTVK